MKKKIRLPENIAFILFLISVSAMDSDNRIIVIIIIFTTLGILFYAGQAYKKTKRIVRLDKKEKGHSRQKKEPAASGPI